MSLLAALLFIAASGLIGWHHAAIIAKCPRLVRRTLEKKIRLSITLFFNTGDRVTYHYRGTCDEMMEMLNHIPGVGTRYGDRLIAACDTDVRETSKP